MTQLLFSLLTSAIIASLAAWLAAHLALRRFYSEKVWEQKRATYSSIFAALHDMQRWFDAHFMLLQSTHQEMPDDVEQKLSADYNEADAKLARELDRERWLLPSKCSERLAQMRRDLAKDTGIDWIAYLENGRRAINSASEDMIALARDDLKIDRPKLHELICSKLGIK